MKGNKTKNLTSDQCTKQSKVKKLRTLFYRQFPTHFPRGVNQSVLKVMIHSRRTTSLYSLTSLWIMLLKATLSIINLKCCTNLIQPALSNENSIELIQKMITTTLHLTQQLPSTRKGSWRNHRNSQALPFHIIKTWYQCKMTNTNTGNDCTQEGLLQLITTIWQVSLLKHNSGGRLKGGLNKLKLLE